MSAQHRIEAKQRKFRCVTQVRHGRIAHWLVVVLPIVFSLTRIAWAESSVLLVVQGATDQDPAPYELRLRSELGAEGLDVVTTSGRSQQNLLDLEGLARRTGALAGISVYVDVSDVQGRLWVSDTAANTDLVRTIRVLRSEGDPVSVFALRAVEALRGARLELEQQRRRELAAGGSVNATNPTSSGAGTAAHGKGTDLAAQPGGTRPGATVPPRTNPNTPARKAQMPGAGSINPAAQKRPLVAPVKRWTIQASGIVGSDRNGLGTIAGLGLEARWHWLERLSLGLSWEGPFFSDLTTRVGLVKVNQELLTAQGRLALAQNDWIALEAVGEMGLSRYAASGAANLPNRNFGANSLGGTLGVGAGATIRLNRTWSLGFDLEWLRRVPAPVIVVRDAANKGWHVTGSTDSIVLGKFGVGVMF